MLGTETEAPVPKTQGPSQQPWRQLSFILTVAFVFPAAVVIGYAIGWWLDSKLGTSPLLSLLFLGIGFAAALLELFRELKRLDRQ